MPKISFCITCMNRLEHLKMTLPINISNALADYENIEFVVLDYNSTDGLSDWIKLALNDLIESKKLSFYQTHEPQSYHRSHSRNQAFRLATGDILVNLDADNFIGKGFTKWVLEKMSDNCFLAVEEAGLEENLFKDALGRVCIWKNDYFSVRGYDELMAGYGFEDLDIKTRLKKSGLTLIAIDNVNFFKSVKHNNEIRIKNEAMLKNLYLVAVKHLEPFKSEIFFFYNNHLYEKTLIVDSMYRGGEAEKIEVINKFNQVIMENITKGKWSQNLRTIQTNEQSVISLDDDLFQWFYPSSNEIVTELVYMFSALKNKKTYFENIVNEYSLINKEGFGKGEVLKNFKEKIIL